MHKALIQWAYDETVVGHLSREGAAIEARETPLRKQKSVQKKKKTKRGRPRKGEERPAEPTRLALQVGGTLSLIWIDWLIYVAHMSSCASARTIIMDLRDRQL